MGFYEASKSFKRSKTSRKQIFYSLKLGNTNIFLRKRLILLLKICANFSKKSFFLLNHGLYILQLTAKLKKYFLSTLARPCQRSLDFGLFQEVNLHLLLTHCYGQVITRLLAVFSSSNSLSKSNQGDDQQWKENEKKKISDIWKKKFVVNTNVGIFICGGDNSRAIKKQKTGKKYDWDFTKFINITIHDSNYGLDTNNHFLDLLQWVFNHVINEDSKISGSTVSQVFQPV